MKQLQNYGTSRFGSSGQRGGLTIFTAVLVLILMTLMLVYATRVSVYETRVSGNEVRQKQAFHVAEAAVDQGIMYVLSNASLILSNKVDPFADGRNGWFSAGNTKWAPCPSPAADTHPCGGGVAATANSFYYDTDGDTATIESLPVGTIDFPPGSNARLSALLCYINDITNPTDAVPHFRLQVKKKGMHPWPSHCLLMVIPIAPIRQFLPPARVRQRWLYLYPVSKNSAVHQQCHWSPSLHFHLTERGN